MFVAGKRAQRQAQAGAAGAAAARVLTYLVNDGVQLHLDEFLKLGHILLALAEVGRVLA